MNRNMVIAVVGIALGVAAGAVVCRYARVPDTAVAVKADKLETGGASIYEKNALETPVPDAVKKDTSSLLGR